MSEQTFLKTILNIEDATSFVVSAKLEQSQVRQLLTEIRQLEQAIVSRIEMDYLL